MAVIDGELHSLRQETITGRKTGCIIHFDGGRGESEDYGETAIQGLAEETGTMYFSNDVQQAGRTVESVMNQIPVVEAFFLTHRQSTWTGIVNPGTWKSSPPEAVDNMLHQISVP